MDPVTALGLASNIYTFVEVGFKAVRQYKDFRQNRLEETRDNADRRDIVGQLKKVSVDLISDGPPPLVALAAECRKLCDELLELLDKLSVKYPDSTRERLGVIFKSYVRSPDISSLENRLDRYRRQLMIGLLQSLRGEQTDFRSKLDNIQLELSQLQDSRANQLTALRSDLLKALQLQADTASQIPFDEFGRLLLQLRDMVTTCGPEAAILTQLRFSEIYTREDTIKPATEGTDLWPLFETTDESEESSEGSNSRANLFTPWLRSGSGIFHISGKAGSGKSTLMKHIWLHDRTREHLEAWAGNKKLLKAAFFFWASGNDEQKSINGLLRSILFYILSHDKSLIPQIFPQCWEDDHFLVHSVAGITRPDVIETAFHTLLGKATNDDYRICLIIDGLDEFEAVDRESYWELAKRFADWADRSGGDMKLCVSSRPYDEFLSIFRASQSSSRTQIHLHELNQGDIATHCRRTISAKAQECPIISKMFKEYGEDLVREIVRRAEGVFLWAVFVVRIVVSEGRRGGSYQDLKRKLEETPSEMDKLYAKMLDSLGRSERELSTRLLFAVLTHPFPLSDMNALCLRWLVDKDAWQTRHFQSRWNYTQVDLVTEIEYVTRRLDMWTQGLVEVVQDQPLFGISETTSCPSLTSSRVRLFHRTARDYLLHSMQLAGIKSAFEDFDLKGLHYDLKLAELAVVAPLNVALIDQHLLAYGYGIIRARSDACFDGVWENIGEYQLTWPVVKSLARVLPSYCVIPISQPFYLAGLDLHPVRRTILRRADHTSLPHLAASLGLGGNHIMESSNSMEYETIPRSLLLSACLSEFFMGDCAVAGKMPSLELMRSLMRGGFTAHQQVKLWDGRNADGLRPERSASVWMILVTIFLACFGGDEASGFAETLGELLRHESQEELIVLVSTRGPYEGCYDRFVTLEDLVQGKEMGAKLLDELQKQSANRKGSSEHEDELTWIWERWNSRTIKPISKHLQRLTAERVETLEDYQLQEVVSRTYCLECENAYVMLW